MINYLDVYTRLCLHNFSDVLVTYYYSGGNKITKKAVLIEVVDFDYITIREEDYFFNVHFFEKNMMIESITPINSTKPIYNNPYINKDLFNGEYIDKEKVAVIKEKILGKKELDSNDKEKIESIKNHVYQYFVSTKDFEYDDLFFSKKQKKEFEDFFEILIKGITNYCEKNGLDNELKLIDSGSSSLIYSIGDKIIKLGAPRRQSNIPYCEYVLQPIINKDYYFDDYPIHVEITQKVKTLKEINNVVFYSTFNEEINDLHDKLESIGLAAHDLHEDNIGILMTENKIHYDSIEFDTGDRDVTSIEYNNNLKVRGPGEFVILDLDCIEIVDMKKYTNYLKSLGFAIEDKIYNHKK